MMPVIREIRSRPGFDQVVCVTGQHREMLDQVFVTFDERPDIDLDVMTPGQTLADVTAKVITRVSDAIAKEKPDLVLVHGDTTTAMAAATAAFYAGVSIGHVEAGLRSFDLRRPWPEEFNRVAIDLIADLMFAPTKQSEENLRKEYNQRGRIVVTGNTGIDALLFVAERQIREPDIEAKMAERFAFLHRDCNLILVTGHRRESFGAGFQAICDGLMSLAERNDVQLVYPVHLNPNVQHVVRDRLAGRDNIHLMDPVGYAEMVYLMRKSSIIVTDSGGIQEEGPSLGKPVLVMRDVTERPEALATGVVKLIGTDPQRMRREVDTLLGDADEYGRRAKPVFPYGDGTAARQIVDAIEGWHA